ncbi:MAG: hypothetical protein ACR2L6_02450, partial [Gemmatimonadaceae bacterium]
IGAGSGLVLILRWYWWRINAWSELSAMITSFVVSLLAFAFVRPRFAAEYPNGDAWVMLVTVAVSTVVWVAVTFATKPESDATLDAFYRRVRPGGPGWATVSNRLGFGREKIPGGALAWSNWLAGVIAVYASLFGIGKLVFLEFGSGLILLLIAGLAFSWIARSFRNEADAPAEIMRREDEQAAVRK